jgi:hypothetical protein
MNKNQKPIPITSNLNDLLVAKNLDARAVEGLEQCLKATHGFYDIMAEEVITFPDFKTKLGAIQTILAYTVGKPVERCEVITKHHTSLEDLRDQAKASPELRRKIQELLDEKPVRPVPEKGASSASD